MKLQCQNEPPPVSPAKLIDMDTPAAEYRQISDVHGSITHALKSCLVIILFFGSMMGCRICPDTEDMAYPGYGGAWERTVRDHGRVGSLFDPAGARASALVDKDLPPEPDEIQRRSEALKDDRSYEKEDDSDPFGQDSLDESNNGTGKDASKNDPLDLAPDLGTDSDDEFDKELERRRKELQDMELQDIQVIPGEPLPPLL